MPPHAQVAVRSLVRKVKGRWRVYGLGTDVECSSDWPDDLIRYCDQGPLAAVRSRLTLSPRKVARSRARAFAEILYRLTLCAACEVGAGLVGRTSFISRRARRGPVPPERDRGREHRSIALWLPNGDGLQIRRSQVRVLSPL